jgi:fructokinase
LARNGNDAALRGIEIYASRLARALAHVVNILDPDIIVLGGGLSNIELLYRLVPDLWGQWVFSDHVETRLVANQHGDSGGVRGAAWLWPETVQAP